MQKSFLPCLLTQTFHFQAKISSYVLENIWFVSYQFGLWLKLDYLMNILYLKLSEHNKTN